MDTRCHLQSVGCSRLPPILIFCQFLKRPVCSVVQRLTTLCNRFGGMSSTVVGEMTHFKLPWLQRPTFTTSGQRRATSSPSRAAATSVADDRHQSTNHTDNHKLPEVYRTLGLDYDERFSPLLRGPTFCAPTLRLSFLASPIISSTSMPRILAFAALHLAAGPRVQPRVWH